MDANQDGVFSSNEIVYTSTINNNADVSGAFTILSSAKLRFTQIRVKLLFQRISTDPCSITEGGGEGETEDYAISILCPQNANFPISFTNQTGTFKVVNTISSKANIGILSIYQSGKFILLEPGFQAGLNETFQARISGCQ